MIGFQHRRRFRPVLSFLALGGAGVGLVVASLSPAGQAPGRDAPLSASAVSAASRLAGTTAAPTVNCPSVADQLPDVPAAAAAEVRRNLQLLDSQIAEANQRLAATEGQGGRNFVQNSILGPLKSKRFATVERIAGAIGRVAERPEGLEDLAACAVRTGAASGGQAAATPEPSADPSASDQPTGQDQDAADPSASAEPSAEPSADPSASQSARGRGSAARTVNCPSVSGKLPQVPSSARREVDRNLALLDRQIAQANQILARLGSRAGNGNVVRGAVLNPLRAARSIVINRIANALRRAGAQAGGLQGLAACTVQNGAGGGQTPAPDPSASPTGDPSASPSPSGGADPSASPSGSASPSASPTGGATGPSPDDFVDIRRVQPNVNRPADGADASRGTFSSRCGTNGNGHFNSDNVIVAPGVTNGAHHVHDYVGNLDTSGFSTNESLQAAGTTCSNGDKSTHYWPVVRLQNQRGNDADKAGGGLDGNVGRIVRPASVSITFRGNPTSKVVAMPVFLRIITGDAKSFTNGPTNANASWSCTGFENRQLKDKYPICPRGSQVVRTFKFQSCWDGSNIDSANHRTHVAFAAADGTCPNGFKAIPALEQRITYNVPPGPGFAVDSFPEQLHKPITDHGDFINVMSDALMKRAVDCINAGRRC
ncbi:DUF1996 domain-containing protein [Sphaerisporangium dianthi]|uniref:DUF1996 domain-containing protein n=1 Tax=Sphaerisporangium dianthi TaxID=1436120 RepID=A0ABV9CWS2_9ACTN